METNWTPERITLAAETHVAYGWAPAGPNTGAWNEEQRRIYADAYAAAWKRERDRRN